MNTTSKISARVAYVPADEDAAFVWAIGKALSECGGEMKLSPSDTDDPANPCVSSRGFSRIGSSRDSILGQGYDMVAEVAVAIMALEIESSIALARNIIVSNIERQERCASVLRDVDTMESGLERQKVMIRAPLDVGITLVFDASGISLDSGNYGDFAEALNRSRDHLKFFDENTAAISKAIASMPKQLRQLASVQKTSELMAAKGACKQV